MKSNLTLNYIKKIWPETDNARQYPFGESWVASMWVWALCASDSVCSCAPHHLAHRTCQLWLSYELHASSKLCASSAACEAVTWPSTLSPLLFCLTTFLLWEAECRNRQVNHYANCKAQNINITFYIKTSTLPHIPLADPQIWVCSCLSIPGEPIVPLFTLLV